MDNPDPQMPLNPAYCTILALRPLCASIMKLSFPFVSISLSYAALVLWAWKRERLKNSFLEFKDKTRLANNIILL